MTQSNEKCENLRRELSEKEMDFEAVRGASYCTYDGSRPEHSHTNNVWFQTHYPPPAKSNLAIAQSELEQERTTVESKVKGAEETVSKALEVHSIPELLLRIVLHRIEIGMALYHIRMFSVIFTAQNAMPQASARRSPCSPNAQPRSRSSCRP